MRNAMNEQGTWKTDLQSARQAAWHTTVTTMIEDPAKICEAQTICSCSKQRLARRKLSLQWIVCRDKRSSLDPSAFCVPLKARALFTDPAVSR